jgi:hypothetical protein
MPLHIESHPHQYITIVEYLAHLRHAYAAYHNTISSRARSCCYFTPHYPHPCIYFILCCTQCWSRRNLLQHSNNELS